MSRFVCLILFLSLASLGKATCPDGIIEETWWGGGQNVFKYDTGTDGEWTLELTFDEDLMQFMVMKIFT